MCRLDLDYGHMLEEPATEAETAIEQGWDYPDPETEERYAADDEPLPPDHQHAADEPCPFWARTICPDRDRQSIRQAIAQWQAWA